MKISKHLQNNYDDYYETDNSEWRTLGALDKARNIESLCGALHINSLIEIGAGEGAILNRLSEIEFSEDYYALEISPTGVRAIEHRNIPKLRECLLFDGYCIPYDNKKFDLAILSHVIEHVEYPRKLIYEANRVAKYVYIEVPLEDTIRLPRNYSFDKVGHINFYSDKTFRRLIQTCNLLIIDQKNTNPSIGGYVFQKGWSGMINYWVKELLLNSFPSMATKIFTYNSSILCTDHHDIRQEL